MLDVRSLAELLLHRWNLVEAEPTILAIVVGVFVIAAVSYLVRRLTRRRRSGR